MDIRIKWYYRIGFILLILITIYVFVKIRVVWLPILKVAAFIILPFLIAGFITYLLHPVVEKLYEKGMHRGLAIFLIYVLFLVALDSGCIEGFLLLSTN